MRKPPAQGAGVADCPCSSAMLGVSMQVSEYAYRAAFLNTTVSVVDWRGRSFFVVRPLMPKVCARLPRFVILKITVPCRTDVRESRKLFSDGFPAVTMMIDALRCAVETGATESASAAPAMAMSDARGWIRALRKA